MAALVASTTSITVPSGGVEGVCGQVVAKDPPVDVGGVEALRVLVKTHFFPHDPVAHGRVDVFFDDQVRKVAFASYLAKRFPAGVPDDWADGVSDDDFFPESDLSLCSSLSLSHRSLRLMV